MSTTSNNGAPIYWDHFQALKRLFCENYKTWCFSRGYRNKYWTLHLSDSVMYKLRVHLHCILIGKNVFNMTKIQVGKKILRLFKKRGILDDLIYTVRKDEFIWNKYAEHFIFIHDPTFIRFRDV